MSSSHRIIPAVWVIVKNDDGEYLLLRRQNTGWEDGLYTTPSGHVEMMEPPSVAGIREVFEETGLRVLPEGLRHVDTPYCKSSDGSETERVQFFFEASLYSGNPSNMEPNKCDDINWFDAEKLPQLTSTLRHVLEQIRLGKPYSELYPNMSDKI